MYCILIKKNQGDIGRFLLNKVVERYISKLGNDDILFAFPGYMSTSKGKIIAFCKELRRIAPKNKIYFTTGMNGNKYVRQSTNKIITEHEPTIIPVNAITSNDHSKFILFIDKKTYLSKAILLGSSNMSYETYVKYPASKGEFDALLISDSIIDDELFKEYFEEFDDKKLYYLKTFEMKNNNDNSFDNIIDGIIKIRDILKLIE